MYKFDPIEMKRRQQMLGLTLAVSLLVANAMYASPAGGTAELTEDEQTEDEGTEEEGSTEDNVTSHSEAGTATGTATDSKAKVSTKTVEEAAVDTELANLIKQYEEVKEKATSFMCDIAEMIGKKNLGRPVVIRTVMEARGVTLETAQSYASRLMKLAKNPDAIKGLRDGTATIRETLYNRKPTPATTTDAGAAGESGASKPKTDTEKKEDKYNRVLKEFVDVAKASGFDYASILAGVKAALKDAGIK